MHFGKMGQANQIIEKVTTLLITIFSWIVLTAIAVIISGKLLAKRIPLGFRGEDRFSINLLILNLRASGDEVSWGFLMFMMSLVITSVAGGPEAYAYFQERTGLDVGQWNSICFIASVLSLLCAGIICLIAPIFKQKPLISKSERKNQIEALSNRSTTGAR